MNEARNVRRLLDYQGYDWARYERTCDPDRQLDGLGDLCLFLGGTWSESPRSASFTGVLLMLIEKGQSTPERFRQLAVAFPREVTAWLVWRPMSPSPTAAELCAALVVNDNRRRALQALADATPLDPRVLDGIETDGSAPAAAGPIDNCPAPVTVRIEAYSPRDCLAHGSLDLSVYSCPTHEPEHVARIRAEHGTSYRVPGARPDRRCGEISDYRRFDSPSRPAPPSSTPATVAIWQRQTRALGIGREHEPGWAWFEAGTAERADELLTEHGWRRVSTWSDPGEGSGATSVATVEQLAARQPADWRPHPNCATAPGLCTIEWHGHRSSDRGGS